MINNTYFKHMYFLIYR